MGTKNQSVFWAVNPYNENLTALRKTAQVIKALQGGSHWQVHPAYVMSPSGFNWAGDFNAPWPQEFKGEAEKAVLKTVALAKLPNSAPPVILENPSSSLVEDVRLFLEAAKKEGASLIVLNTHGRKGLANWLLGSFAQELLLRSPLPLVVVNPRLRFSGRIKHILFPTDLSDSSHEALLQVADLAKSHGARVTLLFKQTELLNPYLQTGVALSGGGWVSIEHLLNEETKKQRDRLERWTQELEKMGLKAKSRIVRGPLSVTDQILKTARNMKPDLIAMDSKAGPVSSFLIGSVAREVIRQANVPVWVLHAPSDNEKGK